MPCELPHAEEEPVGRASGPMVNEMRAADPPKEPKPEEHSGGQPLVHEAIVDEHVADAEQRHPGPRAHEQRACVAVELASDDHERGGDRRVKKGERVVALEPSDARLVMRAVDVPETVMPDAAVKKACPELHGRRGDHGSPDGTRNFAHGPARTFVHEAPP